LVLKLYSELPCEHYRQLGVVLQYGHTLCIGRDGLMAAQAAMIVLHETALHKENERDDGMRRNA